MAMKDVTRRLFVVSGLAGLLGAASPTALAEEMPKSSAPRAHRVVFELSSGEAPVFESLLNNVENVKKAFAPESIAIVVVAHGKGLDLLTTKDPVLAERMRGNADVTFAACANTMKRKGVEKHDLLPFAVVVDSGVAEVVRKQEEGYSYVKAGF